MTEIEIINRLHLHGETMTQDEAFFIMDALEEIQQYRAMEERLKKVYGECDGLLEVVVSGLERHENLELPSITVKSRLLTDENVDMWDEYRTIGTVEEFKALKKKEERFDRNIKMFNSICLEIRNNAIDECIKIIEETTWKDTDMLVESIRELKGES